MKRTKVIDLGIGKITVPDDITAARAAVEGGARITFYDGDDDELGYVDLIQRPGGIAISSFLRSTGTARDPVRGALLARITNDINACIDATLVKLRQSNKGAM